MNNATLIWRKMVKGLHNSILRMAYKDIPFEIAWCEQKKDGSYPYDKLGVVIAKFNYGMKHYAVYLPYTK